MPLWYNSRPMSRRSLSFTLLVLIAVQLLGGMVFASACPEPCPDDTEETSCPPVCTVCTSCTHAQTAIVQHASAGMPLIGTRPFVAQEPASTSFPFADDIFHVPLG